MISASINSTICPCSIAFAIASFTSGICACAGCTCACAGCACAGCACAGCSCAGCACAGCACAGCTCACAGCAGCACAGCACACSSLYGKALSGDISKRIDFTHKSDTFSTLISIPAFARAQIQPFTMRISFVVVFTLIRAGQTVFQTLRFTDSLPVFLSMGKRISCNWLIVKS